MIWKGGIIDFRAPSRIVIRNHLLMAQMMLVHRTRHNDEFKEKLTNVFKGWWLVAKIMTSSAFLEEYLTICHNGHHKRTYETVK